MSNLYRRNGNVFNADSSDATLARLSASYDVTGYEVGAVAYGAQSATSSVTVRAGHGFAANDFAMVGIDTTKFFKIGSVTNTELLLDSGAVTVADGDFISNLGLDTGTSIPNYDGSQVSIYDEPSGVATAISNSRVTCDSEGGYGYWHDVDQVWELVRDSSGTPVEVIPDTTKGVTGPSSATDNGLARFDGTSGKVIQDSGVTVDDSNNLDVPGTLTVDGASTLTGATTQTGKLTCAAEVELDGDLNHDGTNAGFFSTAPTTQPTALTTQLTSLTHTAPSTPDYALADLIDSGSGSAFGFSTKDEGNTVMSVILNLQARVAELEAKLQALGLLA